MVARAGRLGAALAVVCCWAALTSAAALAQTETATTVWAVGDGAGPEPARFDVASLVAGDPPAAFLYLGDVYERGTADEFRAWYENPFGRFRDFTYPTPGNHEWEQRAEGYDAYWGSRVRQADGGHWYSFDLGGWHLISLSSMERGDQGSPQEAWLRQDLARYPGTCTIVFTHYPRFSAGPQYNTPRLEPLFAATAGRAVAWLAGHAHNYQRLLPIRGITQFVVGTGGHEPSSPDLRDPRVAAGAGNVIGALRLRLAVGEASYEFVRADGEVLDSGVLECRTHRPLRATAELLRPRYGERYERLREIVGEARFARRVSLTLVRRLDARRCAVLVGGEGEPMRFRAAPCSTQRHVSPAYTRAPLAATGSFRLRVPSGLPTGGYRLTVALRSFDGRLYRRVVRFRVGP